MRRYLCSLCGRSFSSSFCSIEFAMKKRGLSSRVFRYFCEGLCNRQIARLLRLDEKSVRLRLRRLSEQALLQQTLRLEGVKLKEPICFDGLENFAHSQYEPNNINQAIGRNSLFIFDFNLSPLNRKGRMSDRQKLKKEELRRRMGAFRRDSIELSSSLVFKRLLESCEKGGKLTLLTDRHLDYPKAYKCLGKECARRIEHLTISSKAPRVYRHILFPVNHADLLVRQHVKAFARETISFSKTHGYMSQKFSLFMVWKNFFRPQFTKRQKHNPRSNIQTPAMALGIEKKILRFRDFFSTRYQPTQVRLSSDWMHFYLAQTPDFRVKPAAKNAGSAVA